MPANRLYIQCAIRKSPPRKALPGRNHLASSTKHCLAFGSTHTALPESQLPPPTNQSYAPPTKHFLTFGSTHTALLESQLVPPTNQSYAPPTNHCLASGSTHKALNGTNQNFTLKQTPRRHTNISHRRHLCYVHWQNKFYSL